MEKDTDKKCQVCCGTGQFIGFGDGPMVVTAPIPCRTCGGTGKRKDTVRKNKR